jgi:hypothetical protein
MRCSTSARGSGAAADARGISTPFITLAWNLPRWTADSAKHLALLTARHISAAAAPALHQQTAAHADRAKTRRERQRQVASGRARARCVPGAIWRVFLWRIPAPACATSVWRARCRDARRRVRVCGRRAWSSAQSARVLTVHVCRWAVHWASAPALARRAPRSACVPGCAVAPKPAVGPICRSRRALQRNILHTPALHLKPVDLQGVLPPLRFHLHRAAQVELGPC